MCVVSMIADHYWEKWKPLEPIYVPFPYTPPPTPVAPNPWPGWPAVHPNNPITDAEIAEFRKLLDRAREYDKRNGEPDCENADKIQAIKDLAEKLGIADKIDFL